MATSKRELDDQTIRKFVKKVIAEKLDFSSLNDSKKFIPKIVYEILDDVTKAYLLVACIIRKYTGKLSLEKINRTLEKFGLFNSSEIEEAKEKLLEYGLILPSEGRRWWEISDTAWSVYNGLKQMLAKKMGWNTVAAEIVNIYEEIDINHEKKPLGLIRTIVKRRGKDLVVYIDKGEIARIKYGFYALIREERGYRLLYILHAPNSLKEAREFEKRAREYSALEPKSIEGEIWKKKDLKKIFEITEAPRRRLDILMNGMPRALVFQLYVRLNYPKTLCEQRWYYSKAEKYTPASQGYVSYIETFGGAVKRGKVVFFGENVDTRFNCDEFYELCGEDYSLSMGIPNGSIYEVVDPREKAIDRLTVKTMDLLRRSKISLTGNLKIFSVDYDSVHSILHKLRYLGPDIIYLSGNRVCSLAAGIYYVESLKQGRKIRIFAPHIDARDYSVGYLPQLKLVYEESPSNGFLLE